MYFLNPLTVFQNFAMLNLRQKIKIKIKTEITVLFITIKKYLLYSARVNKVLSLLSMCIQCIGAHKLLYSEKIVKYKYAVQIIIFNKMLVRLHCSGGAAVVLVDL